MATAARQVSNKSGGRYKGNCKQKLHQRGKVKGKQSKGKACVAGRTAHSRHRTRAQANKKGKASLSSNVCNVCSPPGTILMRGEAQK